MPGFLRQGSSVDRGRPSIFRWPHKHPRYVRSHYDTITISLADAPAPHEIMVLFVLAARDRLYARLGGLRSSDVKGSDGLR
jgi:hypothetical protein